MWPRSHVDAHHQAQEGAWAGGGVDPADHRRHVSQPGLDRSSDWQVFIACRENPTCYFQGRLSVGFLQTVSGFSPFPQTTGGVAPALLRRPGGEHVLLPPEFSGELLRRHREWNSSCPIFIQKVGYHCCVFVLYVRNYEIEEGCQTQTHNRPKFKSQTKLWANNDINW